MNFQIKTNYITHNESYKHYVTYYYLDQLLSNLITCSLSALK